MNLRYSFFLCEPLILALFTHLFCLILINCYVLIAVFLDFQSSNLPLICPLLFSLDFLSMPYPVLICSIHIAAYTCFASTKYFTARNSQLSFTCFILFLPFDFILLSFILHYSVAICLPGPCFKLIIGVLQ